MGIIKQKMKNILKEKAALAPDAPGVYLMKDASGKVIYIGKAKSLKERLKSYFHQGLSSKTKALVLNACDIGYRLCPDESMALILEASLVHKYKPKYNVALRDDKSFPMVKITNEEFPAVGITRKKEKDGARYFGPYTNAGLLRKAMKTIRRYFPYLVIKQPPNETRIDRLIGLSPDKDFDKRAYAKRIRAISLILEGNSENLVMRLFKDMSLKSRRMDFEGAGKIRDQIISLGALAQGFLNPGCNLGLEELRKALKLNKVPERIDAFDISDISGKEACGSMVSFYRGQPDKNNYRRFRIKSVEGIDDYGMLREVIKRRYSRLLGDNIAPPDLIIIDGGRGHLLSAKRELDILKIDVPLISIAKKEENIYISGKKDPVRLDEYAFGLNLIRRIRDEAHRFALAYHHLLRRKKVIGR